VPEEVDAAGVGDDFRRALALSRNAYERLLTDGHDRRAAMYALCLGYRLRYVLDLNAREAMQLVELRSGREGHPAYRAIAHAMHEHIAAVHPAVGAAMTHIDLQTEPRLERIVSELRTQAKLDARAPSRA
jgi:thymidylate synthase ThyX